MGGGKDEMMAMKIILIYYHPLGKFTGAESRNLFSPRWCHPFQIDYQDLREFRNFLKTQKALLIMIVEHKASNNSQLPAQIFL